MWVGVGRRVSSQCTIRIDFPTSRNTRPRPNPVHRPEEIRGQGGYDRPCEGWEASPGCFWTDVLPEVDYYSKR